MPRSLAFKFEDNQLQCEINKVDRSKLYGSVSTETLDKDQQRCTLATLAYDGQTLISHGGTALGYMNPQGEWLSRSDLTAVNAKGEPVREVESSFKQTIELTNRVSTEEFLNHSVRLVYSLDPVEGDVESLRTVLDGGDIFEIEFSYRGGTSVDPAFILSNEDGIWLLITDANRVEYANLAQAAVCARVEEPEEAEEEEDDGELDFGML